MKKTALHKSGKIIPNGVKPEPHEMETFLTFANLGKTIELIVPSNTPHSKRPDFAMDGLEWEAKSPIHNSQRTIERIFYEASNQSYNIVIDLRRIKDNDILPAISTLEKCFTTTRKVRRMYLIAKSGKPKLYKK